MANRPGSQKVVNRGCFVLFRDRIAKFTPKKSNLQRLSMPVPHHVPQLSEHLLKRQRSEVVWDCSVPEDALSVDVR